MFQPYIPKAGDAGDQTPQTIWIFRRKIFWERKNYVSVSVMENFQHCNVLEIIPSQMEVAPLHCTVDITQKRSLSKTTKEIVNM